jgi:hypothetical protein
MSEFKEYIRTNIAEMRPVTEEEIRTRLQHSAISVSEEDLLRGSPKKGDMIARDSSNHDDKWLVAKEYFKANFEAISS